MTFLTEAMVFLPVSRSSLVSLIGQPEAGAIRVRSVVGDARETLIGSRKANKNSQYSLIGSSFIFLYFFFHRLGFVMFVHEAGLRNALNQLD